MEFSVADTPAPTNITIFPMIESSAESISFLDYRIPVASPFAISEQDRSAFMELWRGLPMGEKIRCHVPKYLFYFEFPCGYLKATPCWKCNSIFIDQDGERLFYHFDGESKIAQELLRMVKENATR